MASTDNKVSLPRTTDKPVDTVVRTLDETLKVEARGTEDQIADYHQKNPTLKTTGPEHDPEVHAELTLKALKAQAPSRDELAERKADVQALLPDAEQPT